MKTCNYLLLLILLFFAVSCQYVKFQDIQGESPAKISDLQLSVKQRNVTITWTLPTNEEILGVTIQCNDDPKIELTGNPTFYTFEKVPYNKELAFTVKVKYPTGVISQGETIRTIIEGEVVSKIGYFIGYSTTTGITDDDEIASYNWFINTYPDGEIISSSAIEAGIDLSDFAVIFMHIDRQGLLQSPEKLPTAVLSDKVVTSLSSYYKKGGNFLLVNHATQYIVTLGRILKNRTPGIFGSGIGSMGNDIWTFNANIGLQYNHNNHEIFKGMQTDSESYSHITLPLIGPGYREDHNCMWDLNSYSYNSLYPGKNVVEAFETENTATVLGTWGHVTDYCCAGIIEFKPTTTYRGRCIVIGLAAYEWNQNDQTNIYQQNITLLTKNCIEYLQKQ